MTSFEEKYNKSRLRTSYISTVISISLVLFMLGLIGLILLHSKKLSDYVKENLVISVIIKENVREPDILAFQKILNSYDYVLTTEYITKEKAAEMLKKELGEDFVEFLGYNPLLPTIDLKLKAPWANNDSIAAIEKSLLKNSIIKEIFYQPTVVQKVNENVKKISLILLFISIVLFVISFALINSTIRLAVYSKRLIIKSMRLVGATNSFIRRPFLIKGIIQGFVSALIAIAMLIGVIYFFKNQLPELIVIQKDIDSFLLLFAFVIITGIILTWISTFFAVRKYLKVKTIDLF